MFLVISDILKDTDLRLAAKVYSAQDGFESGVGTAGRRARQVKNNEQAGDSVLAESLRGLIRKRLENHDLVTAAARPKSIVRLILSRYREGMAYGRHLDAALMDGQRTDLSFTLFLNAPEAYEGGELVVEEAAGEREVKLPAGSMVIYPSYSLHRVEPVRSGERWTAVGWIRSLIRDEGARDVLYDLAIAKRRASALKDDELVDRLGKVESQLLRRWADD